MPTETRDRIVEATADAFLRQGYAGSGLKEISTLSGAPFGSLYHFFPGGKVELAEAALKWAGAGYQDLVQAFWDVAPEDPAEAVLFLFEGAAQTLRSSDYADACPVATVALEVASSNERLRQASAEVFEAWIAAATERLAGYGIAEARSRELAIQFIATLEGGFLLCRTAQDTTAMDVLGRSMADAVTASLPKKRRHR